MRHRQLPRWVLILGLVSVGGVALAHSGATGVVKERMDAMSEIADHMKMVSDMLRGRSEIDSDQIMLCGRVINGHASNIDRLFPQDSIEGPSEAAPTIWTDREGFTALANDLRVASAELIEFDESVVSPANLEPAFKAMAQTCKACHEKFRIEK